MKKIYLITILSLFIISCSEKTHEEIIERYNNGHRKVVLYLTDKGINEELIYGNSVRETS